MSEQSDDKATSVNRFGGADPQVLEFVQQVMNDYVPFNRLLGIKLLEIAHGRVLLSLPFKPELVGDSTRPALHGGVLAALLDTAGGACVWTTLGPSDRCSTVDMRVDYLLPAKLEELHASAEILRVGNRVGVAALRAYHPSNAAATIADGRAVYAVKRTGE